MSQQGAISHDTTRLAAADGWSGVEGLQTRVPQQDSVAQSRVSHVQQREMAKKSSAIVRGYCGSECGERNGASDSGERVKDAASKVAVEEERPATALIMDGPGARELRWS